MRNKTPAVRLDHRVIERLRHALEMPPGVAGSWVRDLLVRERTVAAAMVDHPDTLRGLLDLNLARLIGDRVEPLVRLDRVGPMIVASDLRRRRRAADFVVGPGPASLLLARSVRPGRAGRLLDLGCGSGIQGLLLAASRTDVLGLDINPRAVAFTRFNAGMNGRARFRAELGDLLSDEPDRALDGRFDTVVANPPFVIAPSHELLYRDRPLPGDEVTRRTIERVARALAPGGRGYVLGNWIDRGGSWSDPVCGWLAGVGLRGAAIRVASHDPATYAAVWTRDLPSPAREAAARAWAESLLDEGIGRIHTGVVAIARLPEARGRPAFSAADRVDGWGWPILEAMLAA